MSAGAPAPDAVAAIGPGAWLVGGAIRDELLGRTSTDVDIAVTGEAGPRARALARAVGGYAFPLSEAFGAWRVTAAGRQYDLTPLVGGTLQSDLARRDLTINAIARPLDGGPIVDPHGGAGDVADRRLRMVAPDAFAQDPLRTVRLARLAADLGFAIDPATADAARAAAPGLAGTSGERIFSELRQILAGRAAVEGVRSVVDLGAAAVVLPELLALRGVQQSRYHHLDVYEHTLAVLAQTVALTGVGADAGDLGPAAEEVAGVLAEPLANELTRGQALRFAALMHDIAKPGTRAVSGDGRVTFFGHDEAGSVMSREILGRWRASEKLSGFVAALTRQHLRLGFLVHEMPLGRREVYAYLAACEPVEVEVTVLSLADRRATAGAGTEAAIARHQLLVSEMLPAAVRWRRSRPRAPVRGDRLAAALGRPSGPWVGAAIDELAAAAYAGEIDGEDAAVAHAREWLKGRDW